MGVLKRLAARWGAARDVESKAPVEGPASARARVARHGGPAATEALDDLRTLERRYGPGVAPAAMRLRNAVLLHRAGRKEESWTAFERMLADPALGGSPVMRSALQSEVYSRMRMALEREGCHSASVTTAVLAYATRAQFHALQEHRAGVALLCSAERFDRHFAPLLARARLASVLPALRAIVDAHLRSLPELDLAALEAAIESLRLKPPSTPARVGADR